MPPAALLPPSDVLQPSDVTVWTIGHSTRTFEEFLALLRENDIRLLVDVRHFPTSARVPWTNKGTLAAALERTGIAYEHMVDLGGYRKVQPRSKNTGWRNESFRGYADYMGTPTFEAAVGRLLAIAKETRTAIMCSEAVPWRCHHGLLSDALVVHGAQVVHILSPGVTRNHTLTSFAKVHGARVTYPAARSKA